MTEIDLTGDVVTDADKWFYDWLDLPCISPSSLKQALDKDEEIILNVNSPGGSVSAGQEIYTKLLMAPQNVVVNVTGQACSAASFFIMAADQINISPVGQIMIHNVSTYADGNRNDFGKMAETLCIFDNSLANAYVKRTGLTKQEVLDLMNVETWLSADKAVELGFADTIIADEELELVASTGHVFPHDKLAKLKELIEGKAETETAETNVSDNNVFLRYGGL